MDNRNPPFDHSRSFGESQASPSQAESQEWQYALQNSQRALLHHSMDSPRLQQFRDNTAGTWAPGHRHFAIPNTPSLEKGRSGSGVQSPDSDTTVKQTNGDEGRDSPSSPGSDKDQTISNAISLMKRAAAGLGVDPGAIDEYLADDAVLRAVQHQPQEHHGQQQQQTMYSLPSPWNPTSPAREQSHSRVSSGAGSADTFVTDYTHTMSVGETDSDGCMSDTYRNAHGFRAPTLADTQDLHIPEQTNLHHRRMSSLISSLPTIPSLLGPGRMMRMGSDTSGLVSPVPVSRGLKLEYGDQRSSVPASPAIQGLHHRRSDADDVGSSSLQPPSFGNGVGHSRQDTDPFVDYGEARTAEPRHFSLPYQSPSRVPKTPSFSPFSPIAVPPGKRSLGPPSAVIHDTIPVSGFPSFEAVTPALPSPRPNLPVPPPPLSSIHGQYTHTPSARAHLDAQKSSRSAWIRESAAQIAQLSGQRYVAQRRYEATQTLQDYAAWQEAEAAFASATDLETKKEERRNLFLAEKGMTALKTDVAGDASASASSTDHAGGTGEERLLGFKMAYMERVCAEVKREEESEGGVTREMLATLTLEERKALRAHLVARLARV